MKSTIVCADNFFALLGNEKTDEETYIDVLRNGGVDIKHFERHVWFEVCENALNVLQFLCVKSGQSLEKGI